MSIDELPFSKDKQTGRAQRSCPTTGELLRACKCRSCIGRRNRRKGKRGQRDARKALSLKSERWSGREANEETWNAALRVEVKTGGRIANPVGIRYNQCKEQSEATRAVGDVRPFVAVFRPDDWSDVLVVIKGSDLPAAVAALVEEWAT